MAENVKEKIEGLVKVTMNLSESSIKMIEKYYPLLREKGLVKNKTQALTYLAGIGEKILNYKINQHKNIYVGRNPDNLKEWNLVDNSGNVF